MEYSIKILKSKVNIGENYWDIAHQSKIFNQGFGLYHIEFEEKGMFDELVFYNLPQGTSSPTVLMLCLVSDINHLLEEVKTLELYPMGEEEPSVREEFVLNLVKILK